MNNFIFLSVTTAIALFIAVNTFGLATGAIISFGVVSVSLIVMIALTYNKIKAAQIKIEEARSNIGVYLQQRYDEISAIYKIAKEYQLHETETFQEIVKLRKMATSDGFDFEQKAKLNNKIEERIPQIMATFENYPELRSNTNFLQLQEAISDNEDNISASRATYNGYVNRYNTKIALFPAVILANMMNFKAEKLYETPANKRENPLI